MDCAVLGFWSNDLDGASLKNQLNPKTSSASLQDRLHHYRAGILRVDAVSNDNCARRVWAIGFAGMLLVKLARTDR